MPTWGRRKCGEVMARAADRLRFTIEPGGALHGVTGVPGDKSVSHRALIIGAIADGVDAHRGLSRRAGYAGDARCPARPRCPGGAIGQDGVRPRDGPRGPAPSRHSPRLRQLGHRAAARRRSAVGAALLYPPGGGCLAVAATDGQDPRSAPRDGRPYPHERPGYAAARGRGSASGASRHRLRDAHRERASQVLPAARRPLRPRHHPGARTRPLAGPHRTHARRVRLPGRARAAQRRAGGRRAAPGQRDPGAGGSVLRRLPGGGGAHRTAARRCA